MYVLCYNSVFFHTKIKLLQMKRFSLTKQENVDWDDYLLFGTQTLFCDSVTWYKYVFLITFWVDIRVFHLQLLQLQVLSSVND